MGTRGAFGIIIGEKEKITYNHFDSYPDGKGVEVLRWLRKNVTSARKIEKTRELAEQLQLVSEDTPATPEQILELRDTTNWHVNQFSMAGPEADELPTENVEWYNLLHATQGDMGAILACGYMEDWSNFPLDSLFCEWAYIIDLDECVFEVYKGFQKTLPKKGRWKGRPTKAEDKQAYIEHTQWCAKHDRVPWQPLRSKYKAVELAASWPFSLLPSNEDFLGYFRLMRARDALAEAKEYPEELAQVVVQIEDEHLNTKGTYAENWQAIYDAALETLSPSDTAKVRMRA